MSPYTVHKGKRYRATIWLNWLEQIANNNSIAQKLRDVGFAQVSVTGAGHFREAKAIWPLNDASAEVPPQVKSVQEIEQIEV
jgi:hypothetical protein